MSIDAASVTSVPSYTPHAWRSTAALKFLLIAKPFMVENFDL